jgi:hypothetical protein
MNALRYLKLVDGGNRPSEKLLELLNAADQSRASVLKPIVEDGYSWLFDSSIDLSSATAMQLDSKFREQGADGSVLPKCVRFFVRLAGDAGIPLSSYITSNKARASGPRRSESKIGGARRLVRSQVRLPARGGTGSLEDKILAMFPEFDPNWSPEAQVAWMERIGELYELLREGGAAPPVSSSDEIEGGEEMGPD